jgi:hypothetical protein
VSIADDDLDSSHERIHRPEKLNPLDELSEVFHDDPPPGEHLHIIVQRPAGESHVIDFA